VALPPDRAFALFTERTIGDAEALEREIERCRLDGWAAAVGEREPDLAAVAAPVYGSRGELAAIVGVQGPVSRFDAGARARAVEVLVGVTGELSARLGWSGGNA